MPSLARTRADPRPITIYDVTSYYALALQLTCRAVSKVAGREEARSIMRDSIDRIGQQIAASLKFIGPDCRLVVLPEYFLTGFPMGDTIEAWLDKAALEIDGPEYKQLGRIAQDSQVFIAGNAYEADENFPSLYFQTSFLLDPSGEVVLRYRRLNSLMTPTPHDVWDKYLETYGLDGVFPVARTEIGNLAAVASDEILFPEVARCFAMRGAEVLLHSSSEAAATETPKDTAKLSRAVENSVYVVSSNSAGIEDIDIPVSSTDGGSKIIDHRGLVLTQTGPGESMAAYAEIDLDALRRFRRRPGMTNLLSRQRFEAYAESYSKASSYPPNTLLNGVPDRAHFLRTQTEVIARLAEKEVI
jgi:predicted amidohydrolase